MEVAMKNIFKKLLVFALSFLCLFNQSFTLSHAQERFTHSDSKYIQYHRKLKSNEGNEDSDDKTFFQKFKIGLISFVSFIATCGFVKWIYDISKKTKTDEVHQGETNSFNKLPTPIPEVPDDSSSAGQTPLSLPSTPPLEESSGSSSNVLTPASTPSTPVISVPDVSGDLPSKDPSPVLEVLEDPSSAVHSSVPEPSKSTSCDGDTDVLECVKSHSHFERIRDGILEEYLSKTSETKSTTALAKLNCNNFGAVMVIGDIHGDIDVLNNYLIDEVAKHLQENPNNAVVVLGDMVNAKDPLNDNSIYVLLYFLDLWNHYPDRVVLLRGNHEDAEGKVDFYYEVYPWRNPQLGMWDKKLEQCLSQLPLYCEINVRDVKFFAVHGNINQDFINAIDRDDLDDELPDFSKWPIYSERSRVPHKSADPEMQGESLNGRFGLTNNHLCMTGDHKPSGYYGRYIDIGDVNRFCFRYGYAGLFRGHDPYYKNIFVNTDPRIAAFTIHTSDNGRYPEGPRIAILGWIDPNNLRVDIYYLKRKLSSVSDPYTFDRYEYFNYDKEAFRWI